jgi:hypothetical protein
MSQNLWREALCVLALLSAGPAAADTLEIDPFDYATAEQAQAAWIAMAGSPPAQVAQGGPWGEDLLTVLPCDFSAPGRDRCYWDHAAALDLTPYRVIALRVYCPDPGPIAWFSLYFRSGNGWYRGGAQLSSAGWNVLVFQREEFAAEGAPAGWDRVDRIRISPWRGAETNTALYMDRLWAYDPEVRIVRGTLTEQAYGCDVDPYCEPFTDWLDRFDVPYALTTDEGVEGGALEGGRLAIFPYNPVISDTEFSRIAAFTAAGGALMTFYDIDPRARA